MDSRLIAIFALSFLLTACGPDSGSAPRHPLAEAARAQIALGKAAEPRLGKPGSCAALEQELKAIAAAEIETWFAMTASPQPMPAGAPPTNQPVNGAEGDGTQDDSADGDFTNNQVAGVDEADFVKTDGERLFVLEGGALHRFDIPAPGMIEAAGHLAIDGHPRAMLLDGDRVLVISTQWSGYAVPGGDIASGDGMIAADRVKTTLIDWPDDAVPVIVQEHEFDGHWLAARETDAIAQLVLHGRLPNPVLDNLWQYVQQHEDNDDARAAAFADLDALALDALLPHRHVRDGNELVAVAYTEGNCANFEIPADSNGGGVTSLITLDLHAAQTPGLRHIVSNAPVVYVSADYLFLAESAQNWWWYWWEDNKDERLNVHAFALGASAVDYLGSARIEGQPINPFALDEHDGVLRVATWLGGNRWWWADAAIESRLYTLDIGAESLAPIGQLDGIAPGEQLFAARFAGDVAYLVTFQQIDPLFTVDLSDPAQPAILGELEVPGFSTYLHPLDGGRLLAVGVGGDASGVTWNTVVSLFDVSDLAQPALLARHDFAAANDGWNWSEALHEHKAFQFHAGSGLLAVPLGASRVDNDVWQWVSTLELVAVGDATLDAYASIDHSTYFSSTDTAYAHSADIRRSFFIGEYIYAVSSKAVSVHHAASPAVALADALITPLE